MLKLLCALSEVVPMAWMRCAVALAVTMLALASYAAPIDIVSAERHVGLVMWDSVYIDEEPYRVETQLGPFADSSIGTDSFASSFVGVIQTDQVDYQSTLLGEARQASHISENGISYSGFVLGKTEPGLVTPDFYLDLQLLTLLGYHCCGVVDGVAGLDVVFEVTSVVDFVFNFTWENWADPDRGPRFSLVDLDAGEAIFWGIGWLFSVEGEFVDGAEDGGSLTGTLDPGSYALSALVWSHWCPCSQEAPGGLLDLDLSFNNPIPEPRSAILFSAGVIIVGAVTRRTRATLH